MSYLLDRKIKRKKFFQVAFCVAIALVLFYFRSGIFNGLAYGTYAVLRPVLVLGNSLGEEFSSVRSFFQSKQALQQENENLKLQLNEMSARMSNYTAVLDDDIKIKEVLGRKGNSLGKNNMTLAAILAKPNQSPYDTLIIDAGARQGIKVRDTVFALGDVPVGYVGLIYGDSSKVVLFSNPGEKTEVVISLGPPSGGASSLAGRASKSVFMQVTGRGGGNFEMILPRDFVLENGSEVVLPGLNPYVLGIVQTIISDPRDSFQKALLVSPVNIQELKFVEVQL